MGLPVVSTRHSGIPEVVEHEVTGLLVRPADATALAEALAQVLEDPAAAERMGERGRGVVIDRFDVENNVRVLWDRFQGECVTPAGSLR